MSFFIFPRIYNFQIYNFLRIFGKRSHIYFIIKAVFLLLEKGKISTFEKFICKKKLNISLYDYTIYVYTKF